MGAATCASSPWLLRSNLLVTGQPHGWANDQVLAAGSRSKLKTCFSVLGCAGICSVAAGRAAPCFPARCPRASLTPLKPWLLLQLFCLSPHTERPCFSGGGQALLVQLKLLTATKQMQKEGYEMPWGLRHLSAAFKGSAVNQGSIPPCLS